MTIQEMKDASLELGISNEDLTMYADVLPADINALFDGNPTVAIQPSVLWFLNQILSPFPCDASIPLDSGVRECWMIDPVRKSILVYTTNSPDIPAIYGFDCKIPVGIWYGECEIDFQAIYDEIKFLYTE